MKIWTISDLHVDYADNAQWVTRLSGQDYQQDLLILAGDITDEPVLFEKTLASLRKKFQTLFFLPGNHDLWIKRRGPMTSLDVFQKLRKIASDCGALTEPAKIGATWIVPLLGWYDYSFGPPSVELQLIWGDYRMCKWPPGFTPETVTQFFTALNPDHPPGHGEPVISFSHFMPRIDLIPDFVPPKVKALFPVMGTTLLERQLRALRSAVHIYGHSHFNRDVRIDGVRYINNAFGYPNETRITRKRLLCLGDA